ncbi:MAG TPA: DUF1858 domain-containing protein [Thermomicrobiales bacterium]|nr:DUF1858 domain-containing protein [Thermomicrobiales bacterium]
MVVPEIAVNEARKARRGSMPRCRRGHALADRMPIADMIVDDLIEQLPATARTFVEHRMQCVGCPMARFETVAEVCQIYRLPLGAFLADIISHAGEAPFSPNVTGNVE